MSNAGGKKSGLLAKLVQFEQSRKKSPLISTKEPEVQELGDEDIEVVEVLDSDEVEPVETIEDKKSSSPYDYSSNPYVNCFFPVLFIDKKMKILFANDACKNLFTGFFDLTGHYFVDVFGKSFGIEELRKIHDTIIKGKNSHFWKGEVKIKSRSIASLQIKVYIFPADLGIMEPNEFIVMFDDETEEVKRMTRNVFLGLLEASKLKDNDTGNDIIRVNFYSERLSKELFTSKNPKYNRIDADFIANIGFLASMHDVGKIGIPDAILNKKGPLNDWEWSIMREHTDNGGSILSSYPNPMAMEIAKSHHEKWDGSGYPNHHSGENIPLAARIVTIADVYDALRMERSYKPAFDHEVAVQKIVEGSESHFDPYLVEVFSSIQDDFKKIFDDNQDIIEG
jgi:putative two-component system response regulator